MIAEKIFHFLKGEWVLKREINPHGSFEGTAKFTLLDDMTLAYKEEGVLTLNAGNALDDVTKRYIYKLEGGGIAVYFNDGPNKGNLFHHLEFDNNGIAITTYDCPPDIYKTKMHLKFPDAFEIIYDVNGPKKQYRIKSYYERAC